MYIIAKSLLPNQCCRGTTVEPEPEPKINNFVSATPLPIVCYVLVRELYLPSSSEMLSYFASADTTVPGLSAIFLHRILTTSTALHHLVQGKRRETLQTCTKFIKISNILVCVLTVKLYKNVLRCYRGDTCLSL